MASVRKWPPPVMSAEDFMAKWMKDLEPPPDAPSTPGPTTKKRKRPHGPGEPMASGEDDTPSAPRHGTASGPGQSRGSASASRSSATTSTAEPEASSSAPPKPVRFPAPRDAGENQLPPHARPLYRRLEPMAEGRCVAPSLIRDDVEYAAGADLPDRFFDYCGPLSNWPMPARPFGPRPRDGDDDRASYWARRECRQPEETAQKLAELDALVDIQAAAEDCRRRGRHQSDWNAMVHLPLLSLALGDAAAVVVEPVGAAAVADDFASEGAAAADFVVALDAAWVEPDDRECVDYLPAAIRSVLSAQPPERGTINQSTYPPLRSRPVGLSIGTAAADDAADEARTRLALWVAAWHRRWNGFVRPPTVPDGVAPPTLGCEFELGRIITLPLLLIVEHEWRLFFAVDQGDHIVRSVSCFLSCLLSCPSHLSRPELLAHTAQDIVSEMQVGDTQTITGMYTILCVLRELANWMRQPFRKWIMCALRTLYFEHVVSEWLTCPINTDGQPDTAESPGDDVEPSSQSVGAPSSSPFKLYY